MSESPRPAVERLSEDRLDALVEEAAAFGLAAMRRGRNYAAEGRVLSVEIGENRISASVRGTRLYRTVWQWSEDGWLQECSCPLSVLCKHAFAVACVALDQARERRGYYSRTLNQIYPQAARPRHADSAPAAAREPTPRPRASGFLPPVRATEPARPAAASRRDAARAPAVGRAFDVGRPRSGTRDRLLAEARAGEEAADLRRLLEAPDFWERQRKLERLFASRRDLRVPLFAGPFPEILREPDSEIMCWMLARVIPEYAEGWLPPALAPFVQRPDLEQRYAGRLRGRLQDQLMEWAHQRAPAAERRLRAVLGLERLPSGGVHVTMEARLSGPRLADEMRSTFQLQQLRNSVRRNPRLLAPDQTALLELLTDGETALFAPQFEGPALTPSGLRRLLEWFAGTSCLVWDSEIEPDLVAISGVTPGEPARLSRDAVRLLPTCHESPEGPRVELAFFWPDGRERRPAEVIYMRPFSTGSRHEPSLVLAGGEFALVVQEPPRDLVQLFDATGGLPVSRESVDDVMAPLAASFGSVRLALARYTRQHAVRPAVTLDLRASDWLQIRLFARERGSDWRPGAVAPRDTALFEYTSEPRWVRLTRGAGGKASPALGELPAIEPTAAAESGATGPAESGPPDATPEDPWIELPAEADVAPLVDWLGRTGAGDGTKRGPGGTEPGAADRGQGWWLKVSARTLPALVEAWESRPSGCDWYGTEAVRRMLAGEHRIRPRLKVESSGIDWLSVSAEWEAEGMKLTDDDLARLRASSAAFVKLSSGWVRRDSVELHDEVAETLADLGVDVGAGPQRLGVWQLAQARPENLAALESLGADPRSMETIARLRGRVAEFSGLPRVDLPAGLRGELRPYQRDGLDFLAYTSSLGLGVILADDMGLGKTVQALAWVLHLREAEPGKGPVLVVCPASVVHNWVREAEHFAPGLRVLAFERGTSRHAARARIPEHDLVVTNYALLRRDLEHWKSIPLRAAILDEAQNIKNPDAAVSRAVLELDAERRLALTGTPLENRALDLWSISTFVNPGYLGSRASFTARFDRADAPPHTRRLLAAKLRPVLLRRLKKQVATELPDRIEERRDCELTPGQRRLYLAELARGRELVERLSETREGLGGHKIEILAALTRLRQICCHPALAGGREGLGSGKFEALFELLEPLMAEGHKVLLFSQFVECLKLLGAEMTARGIPHHVLTGQTVHRDRVVAAFTRDPNPCVFAISLKAGGTGLNLTAASYVVLFDPWWNPAVEAQAIDRTHRIGQERTVIAYRMLAQGTIEEKIWELQQKKAALVRDVLGEDGFARSLSRNDLEFLLAEV